ncbi:trypsin-like serine protease, partial [Kitasatospora sp. NPDC056138]|uniref:S1 family peptidase n=1 Tax=Kitasatospora sp. NPDC056138 TaxID=3345724 RepID=UPI0035DDB3DB
MSKTRPRTTWIPGLIATTLAAGAITAGISTDASALNGDPAADGSYAFTAKITIGDQGRACSGALVDPYWVVTAASCFADNPAQSTAVPAGAPAQKTTVTVGHTDLTTATGSALEAVELVPRQDRDLVMVRLAKPATGITPLAVGATAPSQGGTLTVAGYGRTKTEWVPNKLHAAAFTIGKTAATGIDIAPQAPADAAICKGDTGGPALHKTSTGYELVAVNSRSWQGGCLGSSETRTGAYDTRTDDIAPWIEDIRKRRAKADITAMYNGGQTGTGKNITALFQFANNGNGDFKTPVKAWDNDDNVNSSWDWNRA